MKPRSCGAGGAALAKVYNYGARLVNIHTRLVGAFDAIILSLTAAVTVAILVVLIDPSFDRARFETLAKRPSVVIEQLNVGDAAVSRTL